MAADVATSRARRVELLIKAAGARAGRNNVIVSTLHARHIPAIYTTSLKSRRLRRVALLRCRRSEMIRTAGGYLQGACGRTVAGLGWAAAGNRYHPREMPPGYISDHDSFEPCSRCQRIPLVGWRRCCGW